MPILAHTAPFIVETDATWQVSANPASGWNTNPSHADPSFAPASISGGLVFDGDHINQIWNHPDIFQGATTIYIRKVVNLPAGSTLFGKVDIAVDDDVDMYVNGHLVITERSGVVTNYLNHDVSQYLVPGDNLFAFTAIDAGGAHAFVARLEFDFGPPPAGVVLSNLGPATNHFRIAANDFKAQAFQVAAGADYLLESVKISIESTSLPPTADFELRVHEDASGPGAVVGGGLLVGNPRPTLAGVYTYKSAVPIVMQAGKKYWLAASMPGGSGNYRWRIGPDTYHTAVWTPVGEFARSTDGGATWASFPTTTPYLFEIAAIPLPNQVAFHAIGDLPGGLVYSEVRDATRTVHGIVAVGGSVRLPFSPNSDTAVRWTPAGGLQVLQPHVLATSAHVFISASAITPDGSVIAARSRTSTGFPPARMAVTYTNSGTVRNDLGYLPNANFISATNSISSDGSIVYGFAAYDLNPVPQGSVAFRWTAATGMVPLGFARPGDVDSTPAARGTSANGNIMVGSSAAPGGQQQAYRYVHGVGMSLIPYAPGGTWSAAEAITPDGQTVILRGSSTAYPGSGSIGEFFRWTQSGGHEPLGMPTGKTFASNICGVTSDGRVITANAGQAGVFDGYIRNDYGWHGIIDILRDAGVNLTGWTQFGTFGCTWDGTLLFGYGIRNGNREGFVAEFPVGYLANYRTDVTPPVLTLPADITTEATSASGAVVHFTATAVDDVDGQVPVVYSQDPGTVFPLGTTTITVSATDGSNNVATGSFNVTVRDTTAPTINGLAASPNVLWPANNKMVAVSLSGTAIDLVDPAPTRRIVAVVCNEPAANDWIITGDMTLQLRATRAGAGSGRVYSITVEASDAAGNTSTATISVSVPHDQGKG